MCRLEWLCLIHHHYDCSFDSTSFWIILSLRLYLIFISVATQTKQQSSCNHYNNVLNSQEFVYVNTSSCRTPQWSLIFTSRCVWSQIDSDKSMYHMIRAGIKYLMNYFVLRMACRVAQNCLIYCTCKTSMFTVSRLKYQTTIRRYMSKCYCFLKFFFQQTSGCSLSQSISM